MMFIILFGLCTAGALASENVYLDSAREVYSIYSECAREPDGLSPCLKLKALSVVDDLSRVGRVAVYDGVTLTGNTEASANELNLEEEEKNLPRSLEDKNSALTTMLFNRVARMIGSKSIEISFPTLVESGRKFMARKTEEDSKFGDLEGLLGGGGGGHGGGGHGGGGGGLGGGGKLKKKKKGGGDDIKDFLMMVMAKKIALIPLFIGALLFLSFKALAQAKVALLIAGIIFGKKLLAQKQQGGGGGHVEHIQAGWSGGGGGSGGGWSSGGGGGGGWDRRSLEAQNLAYQAQKA